MPPLPPELRRYLERAVVSARGHAETAARAVLARLAVADDAAPAGIGQEERRLRVQLRARSRVIGRDALIEEIAYEQWHRMLFARFLAENGLLLHPEGAPVTLDEVRELAAEEGERDRWVLAARYAAAMLPGIFSSDDPANRVSFAPEDRSRLETTLEALPSELFSADDALGWVYQFWQSQRKDEVNKRGDKIGGAELPPVTQLFTEHYMVRFLLENSLGAWWARRHPDSPLLVEWEYLRFRDDGRPAAGTFEGWPTRAAEVTVMDPCCGSGHFIVAASAMLRKMRSEEEGLSPAQAAVAVLADNLFGLELDARCLQLAAFNLALDAWKAGGYQPLPVPNLACTGIAIKGQRADWHRLAGGDANMANALDRLYDLFQDAPELGSLIDPRSAAGEGLWAVDVDDLLVRLDRALQREASTDPAAAVFGAAAAGTAKAAQLLSRRYWLVATNPPFLGARQMSVTLQGLTESAGDGRNPNLATSFHDRCRGLAMDSGAVDLVLPHAWWGQETYEHVRRSSLRRMSWVLCARLGTRAFTAVSGEVVNVVLQVIVNHPPQPGAEITVLEVQNGSSTPPAKAALLQRAELTPMSQSVVIRDRRARVVFGLATGGATRLGDVASALQGTTTGDNDRWTRRAWEIAPGHSWRPMQTSVDSTIPYGGRSASVRWSETGPAWDERRAALNGSSAFGQHGVLVRRTGDLPVTIYTGDVFDMSSSLLLVKNPSNLIAVWAYCCSPSFREAVRRIDSGWIVTNGIYADVPFDLEHWTRVAAEQYPDGLPEPHSDDPTQWLFKGNVAGSEAPLQVAVARLLGYRWPDQERDALDALADPDGLVPLVSVSGERPAAERLRAFLALAYGEAWSPPLLERLLAEAGSPGATLETWLRDDFFAQHTKLFQQRPFIWNVWDGRKDGFSILCHYHRLDRAKLERMTYTLLGDWIERQRAAGDEPGAEARLNAALALQEKLRLILEGEAPYDIYVRWKSLAEQPLGWEPDLDDGVRLNIRPFVTAEVLRAKLNVKWDKDRGKEPDGSERINDRHPTVAEKRAARAAAGKG